REAEVGGAVARPTSRPMTEKQDSLLNNMFNMITKLTGQLSDKEQNDSSTNKIASIGVLAIQPTSSNPLFKS
ncbi:hypothetical protein RhiirB3_460555, partial [Rhizophagus irregularis]